MASVTRSKLLTFDDFCFLVRDGQKGDLINGVIYMASPENTDANKLFMWLGGLMHDYAEVKELGEVFGSRVAFRIDDGNGPEPDIAFVRRDRLHLIQNGFVDGPPDIAVEIVSPESVERDYEDKRAQYEKAGVTEYWIIDEVEERTTFLRLGRDRKYHEARPRKGEWHSRVLTGFWFRLEWLWQNPRPKKVDVLRQLLG
jgi:Uma2 family endonuclease